MDDPLWAGWDAELAACLAILEAERNYYREQVLAHLDGEAVPGAPQVFDGILPALDTGRWRYSQTTKTWEARHD